MTGRQLYNSWRAPVREAWHRIAGSQDPAAAVRAYVQAQLERRPPPFKGPIGYVGTVRTVVCYKCGGHTDIGHGIECRYCEGAGMVEIPYTPTGSGARAQQPYIAESEARTVRCDDCHGWRTYIDGKTCATCAGRGTREVRS